MSNGFRASIGVSVFFLAPKPILRPTCIWRPFWLHWAPWAKFWGVKMPKSSTWGSRPSRGRRMALPWPLVAFVVRFMVLLGAQMTTWAGGWSMGAGARGLPHLVLAGLALIAPNSFPLVHTMYFRKGSSAYFRKYIIIHKCIMCHKVLTFLLSTCEVCPARERRELACTWDK